jgi:hypothetical protein
LPAICPQNAVSLSPALPKHRDDYAGYALNAAALIGQLKARRSVRQFTQREIAPELIEQIIEAGRLTPTGTNSQNVSYAVLREHIPDYEAPAIRIFQRLKRVIDLVYSGTRNIQIDDHFLFKNASAVIVIKSGDLVNGALAASSMELMAQSLGLGVFYSGFFTMIVACPESSSVVLAFAAAKKWHDVGAGLPSGAISAHRARETPMCCSTND